MQKGVFAMKNTKYILFLLIFLAVTACYGRSHRILHRTIHRPSLVSWQHIAAGGAAAGTIITAYKVSNGIEDGLNTIAEKDPKAFSKTTDSIMSPLRLAAFGIIIIAFISSLIYLTPKMIQAYNLIRKD